MVEKGLFRADLYYRLKNFQLDIPPLRHRKEDINPLLDYYIKKNGYNNGIELIGTDVLDMLNNYTWPGNIRELRNIVDAMLLKYRLLGSKQIDRNCLPGDIFKLRSLAEQFKTESRNETTNLKQQTSLLELEKIESALLRNLGRKTETARELGLNPDQLRYKVKRLFQEIPEQVNLYPTIVRCYWQ
jgi:transcriptional regulator with GAF, ATPase, and Fis domain